MLDTLERGSFQSIPRRRSFNRGVQGRLYQELLGERLVEGDRTPRVLVQQDSPGQAETEHEVPGVDRCFGASDTSTSLMLLSRS